MAEEKKESSLEESSQEEKEQKGVALLASKLLPKVGIIDSYLRDQREKLRADYAKVEDKMADIKGMLHEDQK